MKNNQFRTAICLLMSATILCTPFPQISAARKATIVTKKITLKTGESKKIVIKNKQQKMTYSFKSSNPKKASVTKKGVIKARKKGSVSITVSEGIKKKFHKIGAVKVKIQSNKQSNNNQSTTETIVQLSTQIPTVTVSPAVSSTASPVATKTPITNVVTPEPTQTAIPAPTRTPLVIADHDTPAGFDQKQSQTEYGTLSKITYHSNTTGTDRKANIITPAGYSTDKKYPVLYLFHGGNGDENDWLDGKPEYIIGNLIAKGEAEDMIIVMPNCRSRENDAKDPSDSLSPEHMDAWTNFLNDFTDDLMPYIQDNYPVLTGRENTAIAGLSMGGRTSLYLGFSVPDKVSYIGAFSPAFGIFEYENWGLHEDGYFTEDNFKFPDKYMDNTTCLIMSGENDTMVRTEPERYHNALVANKVNHYYYTMPGDHEMNVWKNGLYNFAKLIFK